MPRSSWLTHGAGPRASAGGRALRGAARSVTLSALAALLLLGACSTPAPRMAVYDFGPGATQAVPAKRMAPLPPLLLGEVEAPAALDGTAMLYRLMYSDGQQLRPYAQARWSMPPAQLLRQRLRELLGQHRSVLSPTDAVASGTLVLRLELEEFSQLFDAAQASAGLIRLRATLGRSGSPARMLAQTSFVLQQPGAGTDAAGGVRALARATDVLAGQLDQWLQQVAGANASAPGAP